MNWSNDDKYYAESIIQERVSGSTVEYLLTWCGYRDATWQSAENLTDCTELVGSYISSKYDKKKKPNSIKTCPVNRQFVRNPTNPPKQLKVSKIYLERVWRGKPLYCVQYSNQYPAILTSQQLSREMPPQELAERLEQIYLRLLEK